jgi:hypothetical protein
LPAARLLPPPEPRQDYAPHELLTNEARERAREPAPPGIRVDLGVQPAEGEPALKMEPLFEGSVTAEYVAEWHTGVIDELVKLKPSWAHPIRIDQVQEAVAGLGPTIEEVKRSVAGANLDGVESIRRSFLNEAFARDVVIAAALGANVHLTSLFRPLLTGAQTIRHEPARAGGVPLSILVPDVTGLSWEGIAAFRDHPASEEARARLREIEERAAQEGTDDAEDFLQHVAQEVANDLLAALNESRGHVQEKVAKEGLNTVVGLVPGIGPLLGAAAATVEIAWEVRRDRRSWLGALISLRDAAWHG